MTKLIISILLILPFISFVVTSTIIKIIASPLIALPIILLVAFIIGIFLLADWETKRGEGSG